MTPTDGTLELPVAEIAPGPLVRAQRVDLDHAALLIPALDEVPPVLVRQTGSGWSLIDGQHRLSAAITAGRSVIRATVVALDDAEAIERAVEANTAHGKPLTLGERKAAARRLIAETQYGDRRIATICTLDERTVAAMRPDRPTAANGAVGRSEGADGKSRPASKAEQKAQREEIAAMLAEHPDLSLSEIARRVGCSTMTVASVRTELAGKGVGNPQPDRAAEPDTLPPSGSPHAEDRSEEDEAPARPPLAPVPDAPEGPPSVGDVVTAYPVPGDWRKHPAMARSNAGRDLATVLDRRLLRDNEHPRDLAAQCPAEMREQVAAAARAQAGAWLDLADRLTQPVALTEARA